MWPPITNVQDLAIIVGFIGTCAILLWRMRHAEIRIKDQKRELEDQEKVIDTLIQSRSTMEQQYRDHSRRIARLEDRVYNGRRPWQADH